MARSQKSGVGEDVRSGATFRLRREEQSTSPGPSPLGGGGGCAATGEERWRQRRRWPRSEEREAWAAEFLRAAVGNRAPICRSFPALRRQGTSARTGKRWPASGRCRWWRKNELVAAMNGRRSSRGARAFDSVRMTVGGDFWRRDCGRSVRRREEEMAGGRWRRDGGGTGGGRGKNSISGSFGEEEDNGDKNGIKLE